MVATTKEQSEKSTLKNTKKKKKLLAKPTKNVFIEIQREKWKGFLVSQINKIRWERKKFFNNVKKFLIGGKMVRRVCEQKKKRTNSMEGNVWKQNNEATNNSMIWKVKRIYKCFYEAS